ncbi:type II secretion system inner membrane protein GspF [Arhodomonas aquaeolei]|uniref:type II secretion system inner membrane protein GspF n=1 Tax=Arhodomonas TaxID=2368 RepID=UPI0013CF9E0A|nr:MULTISPECIES: type II secretion system inner membrane protein GspF [Arhodomonas]MCS4502979.1 type II secretion system inner membrane protein GspF [Arhodomonas aquaeolei]
MAAYEYTALDTAGREHGGVLEGDSPRQVRQQLRERGWLPVAVEEVRERRERGAGLAGGRARIRTAELVLFTRQLATLVGSGTPLEEALRTVARQSERPAVRRVVTGIRARVVEGHPLAAGIAAFPRVFSELYRATVAAGEQTGHLDIVLERLADYVEKRQQMRQRVQQALIYPLALVVISIGVVTLLLTYVVPKVTRVFADTGQALPALTRGLIATSGFLRDWGWALLLVLAAAAVIFSLSLRRPAFRRRVHASLLRLPLVGRLTRGLNTARFARTFSILMGSGVAVLEALRISAGVIANLPMREAVADAASRIREGTGIAPALEASGQFPPMTVHLVASGEGSGNLEGMLERAAASQEREIDGLIGTLLALFEPLLIVVMGGIVLVIVLSIMLPIFELNQLVGR